MKDCAYIKALLFDFASGKLDEDTAKKVKDHIDVCDECRKEYLAHKLYFENLPYVSEYFDASGRDIKTPVMQKIREEKENPPVYVPRRFHFSYGTAASLVLVAALFIFAMKTGIADKQSFECEDSGVDTAEEIVLDEECAEEEYDYRTADYASGTGAADNGEVYFSATTTNDAYYDVNAPTEKAEERLMMMAAPPMSTETEGCAAESVSETEPAEKKKGTQSAEIQRLTLEELRGIVAEKGGDMTWSDFECYEHSDIGSGIYIFRYPISEYLYLTVSGVPEGKIFEIRLVSQADSNNYITLPDGDIDGFVNGLSS